MNMLVLLFLSIVSIQTVNGVTVTTKVGKISGYIKNVVADGQTKTISKFMSIPYAESSSGQNRFLKPIPKAPFNNTFQATTYPVGCIQSNKKATNRISSTWGAGFSEDCLILNVYVPHDFSRNVSLPVMVWIYGGSFVEGASAMYPADVLNVYADVVVVVINYRLGMFGFLQSADGKLPGNQGLWDQHLALKWVHENIEAFTGDPNRVTIFGESAGGASVLFQALYPENKGYFQRVIAESGSPLADWATAKSPNADEFIKRVGCDGDQFPISCLRMKSASELQIPRNALDTLVFRPSLDGEFLVESPAEILFGNNAKSASAREFYSSLDILSGVNNFDGALFVSSVGPEILKYTDINNPRISRSQLDFLIRTFINNNLSPKDNYTRDLMTEVATFVYTNWADPDAFTSTRMSAVEIISDVTFFHPAIRAAQAHASVGSGSTYFYEFSVNIEQHVLATPDWIHGSSHADEIAYVLGLPLNGTTDKKYGEGDKHVARAVATMWSNFANSGNPNTPRDVTKYIHTTWPEYSMTSQEYFQISQNMTSHSVRTGFYGERMSLWSDLLPKLQHTAEHQETEGPSSRPIVNIVGR